MLGVDVFIVFVLRSRGLSDTGVSSVSGVAGSWDGGVELPLTGVFSPSPLPISFFSVLVLTRMGVLSTTTSPPRTQPGDLGSMSVMVLTGVSHGVMAAPAPDSTAMGVLSTPSLAERGSVKILLICDKIHFLDLYFYLNLPDLRILDLSFVLKDFFSPEAVVESAVWFSASSRASFTSFISFHCLLTDMPILLILA